jgi:hypothetical protein
LLVAALVVTVTAIYETCPAEDTTVENCFSQYKQFMQEGKYGDALLAAKKRREAIERTFPPESIQALDAMQDVARACQVTGKYQEAISLLFQICPMRGRIQGTENPDYALCGCDLAASLYAVGRAFWADEILRRTLAMGIRGHHTYLLPSERIE